MRAKYLQSLALATLTGGAALFGSSSALASNPLEYPDNGSASFSRGGAWLALANEPIATHYNPAGLAIQGSGFSIEQQLNFQKICYDRRDKAGNEETAADNIEYAAVCNGRGSFPATIPSISLAWRVSKKLGLGLAVVPPAAYGNPDNGWPAMTPGTNLNIQQCLDSGKTPEQCGGASGVQQVPAPYRYQQLNQQTLIVFPTIGVGYEVVPKLRVGAAFISGIAVVNASVGGIQTEGPTQTADHAGDDSFSIFRTKDLFVPGAILSLHWSPLPELDVAAWGRWISPAESTQAELYVTTKPYTDPTYGTQQPICRQTDITLCSAATAPVNLYGNTPGVSAANAGAFKSFKLPYPPELRLGLRYHHLRTWAGTGTKGDVALAADAMPKRDPLHEDIFDIELDGSYTFNEAANTVEIRFIDGPGGGFQNGAGILPVRPVGFLPPNADKWNGWQNSVGIRLGGQWNAVQDKFAVRAGTWIETQAEDPKWLSISAVPSLRGGFGGGIVFRQDFLDISIGYQRHWASGLNNNGEGAMRAVTGAATTTSTFPEFNTNREPPGVSAADRTQFRSVHFVNDGRVTQSAHAFTLGGTIRF